MSSKALSDNGDNDTPTTLPEKPKCGIIMPISAIGDYPASHWEEVKLVLKEAIDSAGFDSDLVSEAEDSTIIQKTIVQNLYNNSIVVCDVSGKNPNVMFELGIRLTFDKPTVVVKDKETDYSFDTSPIEHVPYPSDLNYHQIVRFKKTLAEKIKATHKAAEDPRYSTFLKHFGQFTVPKLEQKEVSGQEFIIEELRGLRQSVARLVRSTITTSKKEKGYEQLHVFSSEGLQPKYAGNLIRRLHHHFPQIRVIEIGDNEILLSSQTPLSPSLIEDIQGSITSEIRALDLEELREEVNSNSSEA